MGLTPVLALLMVDNFCNYKMLLYEGAQYVETNIHYYH